MGAPEKFLGMSYWNREKETADLVKHINDVPNSILFVFGPKSSGKSTTVRKIISESKKDKVFFFYDLRMSGISNYYDFVDFFTNVSKKNEAKQYDIGINLAVFHFGITSEKRADFKENKKLGDVFELFRDNIKRVKNQGKMPIIVIDELQMLKYSYKNGEKKLFEELFNFFVTITKTEHLAHVICMSSDSLFIDEVYCNSVLKKTSGFYLFDSFDRKTTVDWLFAEGIDKKTARSVFDKLGGECWYLQEYLRNPQELNKRIDLEEGLFRFYLGGLAKEKRTRVRNLLRVFRTKEEVLYDENKMDDELMRELVNKEILFYDPLNKLVKPQSRLMLNVLRKVV